VPWETASPATSINSGIAKSGIRASIGITAISWNKRTEKLDCPPSLFIRPFSLRVCRTMAVEDSAMTRPMARAMVQGWPEARGYWYGDHACDEKDKCE